MNSTTATDHSFALLLVDPGFSFIGNAKISNTGAIDNLNILSYFSKDKIVGFISMGYKEERKGFKNPIERT